MTDPADAYERELERRLAPLDYPPHLAKAPVGAAHDCGKACHCDHYDEPGPDDE